MINTLKKSVVALVIAMFGLVALSPAALAVNPTPPPPSNSAATQIGSGASATGQSGDLRANIQKVVNILLFVLGLIAVIVIVIAGIRYTTSGGDAAAVKGAKDTILYAIVGLVVAILAFAIVNFGVGAF